MAYSFHQHQPSPSCFDQLNDNDYDEYPESLSSSSSNCHSTECDDSSPVVNPPRIAVNSRLNLLSRFEDAIGLSQLPSWINASASLKTKDNSVKASAKVTTSQTQADNTTQRNASTEITPSHAKSMSASRIPLKCNQKT